jgi:hypothetical protein
MPRHDVFICYSSKDEARARAILAHLEQHGIRCWISSRDVRPGRNYQDSIVEAIESAKIILFLLSEFSNKTGEVKKELSLASSFDHAVIPLRLTDTKPNAALLYELATRQWIDAFPDLDVALGKVVAAMKETLRGVADAPAPTPATAGEPAAPPAEPSPPPAWPAGGAAGVPVVVPGSAQFEALRIALARHVGPIAKILVQRAAADAGNLDTLCERLAQHVSVPADRAAFLRAVRAQLPVSS